MTPSVLVKGVSVLYSSKFQTTPCVCHECRTSVMIQFGDNVERVIDTLLLTQYHSDFFACALPYDSPEKCEFFSIVPSL